MSDLQFLSVEQIFNRRSAVKLCRIFAAEHGVVNPDTSCYETGCDGSPASEAMLHRLGGIVEVCHWLCRACVELIRIRLFRVNRE